VFGILLRFVRPASRVAAAFAVSALLAWSAPPDRVREVRQDQTVRLSGSVHPRVASSTDQGVLDPATRITGLRLVLKPSSAQQAALEQLLEEQRDPVSPNYRKWLTPEEYGDQFGVSANDLGTLSAWLALQGFTVEKTARASNWISFSGTAGDLGRAFGTEMHRYQSSGESHFANATEISVPEAFSDVADSVLGMNDFLPKPPARTKPRPEFNASNGNHYLAPDDLATIYDIAALYAAGFDGTGQKLAIIGQTDINLSDIRGFRSQFGLPANDPQLLLDGADPGVSAADETEADLDLEWSGAVARNATIIYVYSQNVFESLQYAIDQNVAPVISMSYGSCEAGSPSTYRTLAQQANSQGITWMNSSGDSGAAGCDYDAMIAVNGPSVTFPADIPEVTAVGGSEFNEANGQGWASKNSSTFASATGYLPEKAWNDSSNGGGIAASGGGASVTFRKPWWQSGAGVPNDNDRDVPDVALTASADHDGYLLYTNGNLTAVGGTSASSPVFAGLVSILNQYLVAKGVQSKAGLGNINPNLYSLAQGTTTIFHDITAGNNVVPCKTGTTGCTTGSFGYNAGPGYDLVTGLGSVDAFNLVSNWTSLPAATGTTMTLTSNPSSIAQSASTTITALVKAVSGTTAPTGSVTFTDGGTTLGSATLVNGSASITVKATSLSAGSNVLNANYAPTGSFASSSASVTVTVTVPLITTSTTLTVSPASITTSGSTQLTATVKAASGSTAPSGAVTFMAGTTNLGTANLTSGSASLSVNASALSVGTNAVTAVYAANSTFGGSTSKAVSVTVTAPPAATTTLVSANPTTIEQTGSTVLTATVKPASGNGLPSGTVNFSLGSTVLGLATLAPVGGVETATLTVKGSKLAVGSNTITATYSGATAFSGSSASLSVVVNAPLTATTTSVSASPASIASTASTQLTATVKAASGSTTPGGNVSFTVGSTTLGSATLAANGTASITVKGSSLGAGRNVITASYSGAAAFTASAGSVTVSVTAPSASVTLAITASPATIAQNASTQLTITAKTAGGSAVASGTATLTSGTTSLGSASIKAGSATLSLPGSSLAVGANTITAAYSGATATVQVTVTASNVALSAVKGTTEQPGFPVTLEVQEQSGVASTLTGLTINGTSFSSEIAAFFGTTKLAAHGTLTAQLLVQWSPMPSTLTFVVSGVDASGQQWSQTTAVATQ